VSAKNPRKSDRDAALVEVWSDRIRRGYDAKADFTKAAREIDGLFTGEPDPWFKSDALAAVMNVEHMACVTVNLPFQVRSWLGPNLYQRNPTRTVTSRTKDSILSALGAVLGAGLNYTPNETGLADESRMAVDEALTDGRSFAYTGYDATTGLITSWFVSVDDVVIDPDAKRVTDAYWIALRRREPRWKLEKEFSKSAAIKDLPEELEADPLPDGTEGDSSAAPPPSGDEDESGADELVTFYEVYSRMGVGWRGADVDEELGGDDAFDYRKIVFVPGYDTPLHVGRWETPLYVDGVWPLTGLDLTPTKNTLWPVSLIKAALPSLRAVNLLTSIALEKAKQHAREIYGIATSFENEDAERIVNGGLSEVVKIEARDGLPLGQLVQRWEGGQISPEIREQINFHLNQIGEVTGLLPILKGQSSEQQIRSATEADIQDRNARSRLQDLSERVEDWSTRLARNEGLLWRLEMSAKEVSKYLDANVDLELGYRIRLRTFGGVVLPTRLYAPGSDVDPAKEEPCLQGIAPGAAQYFQTREEAEAVLAELLAALPSLQQSYFARTGQEVYLERNQDGSYAVDVGRVTVDDVWVDTAYLGPSDLAREISFRIESGSTKRPDANKKIDQANTLMASVGQPALQMGNVDNYNEVLAAVYESQSFPPKMRVFLQPPPPPPMPPPGGAPQGGPPA
jgi:hypothetical protein